ncbi:NUDIX hydrolase [Hymenobacter busanensis]|uniref:NUDIX hydrolase n=1 Tax=Hymenobacter busanensis TaxID=2607656 RepID=UPI001366995C|nr:CoA pyrophosphatase [Hymenobacter busanensis]QHJ09232.1 NUDIX domain-containing protein [Hymenobacter busanensis]
MELKPIRQAAPNPPLRDAAVLVPVFRDAAGELRLVLVRRGNFGVHGGQLAFPGGKADPTDASPLHTALREAEEEVSLRPEQVTVLATLPVLTTFTTGFRVAPFLGRINRPTTWHWQTAEIDEVLEVPVRELTAENHATEMRQLPGWPQPAEVSFYRVAGGHQLWGLSYRIVRGLLPRLQAGEWEI